MIIRKSVLHEEDIYLEHQEATRENDSGWYMGSVCDAKSEDAQDYMQIYTYQLLSICEEALSLLHLPIGTLALFKQGKLVEVVDSLNTKIL